MKKISLGTLLVLLLISYLCHAQFTRDQARELVINQLCAQDLNHVKIYLALALKFGQSRLILHDADSISCPFDSNWVFFIDDDPSAGWAHECHYMFVNAENGDTAIVSKRFFPIDLKTNFELISSTPQLNFVPPDPEPYDIPYAPENPHLYAVLICGPHENIFWNDVSAVFSTLRMSYGFKNQNIYVHYADGPNQPMYSDDLNSDLINDIRFNAHKPTINATFNGLAFGDPVNGIPKLTPEDVLFVFTSDHGDTTNTNPGTAFICLPGNDRLSPTELATYVKNINCSQMVFLMAQCFSGGFIDDLMNLTDNPVCKNRYIYTSASARELSHHELWTHDGDSYFFEFVYYWVAATRRHYPHWQQPWRCAFPLGVFPFSNYPFTKKIHSPDFNPDSDLNKGGNNDLIIQMREAFNYADSMDSWSPNGYHSNYIVWNPLECKDENPQSSESLFNGNGNSGFKDNVIGLAGITGLMNTDQTIEGNRNYLFGGDFTIDNNRTLTVGQDASLYVKENIIANGNIAIGNNVNLFGSTAKNFNIYGSFQIGDYASIENCYLTFHEQSSALNFNHANFLNSGIAKWNPQSLTINNSNLGYVVSSGGDVTVTNSICNLYPLHLENNYPNSNFTAVVNGCIIHALNHTLPGIEIDHYSDFSITSNTIENQSYGIRILNSGYGSSIKTVAFNNISYCGVGVCSYSTDAVISNNRISSNDYGIHLLNNSNTSIQGNPDALTPEQTQVVANNQSYEIYATNTSFPYYFKYNKIVDEDNGGNSNNDPLVYYHTSGYPPVFQKIDVTQNCWGNNFIPAEDLFVTYGRFYVDPKWCPPGNHIDDEGPEKELYDSASAMFDSGSFTVAKTLYSSLINQYPYSEYASASLKKLFNVEKYAGNDYSGLQQYYLTSDSIIADTILVKIADFFANKCNESLGNWPEAISWYENRILNPPSYPDSLFAIIDLENVYFHMQNSGQKASYRGQLTQYIPQSRSKFLVYRDSLLSLLPYSDNKTDSRFFSKSNIKGFLINCIPNPFETETKILFKLNQASKVSLVVSNFMNKEITRSNLGQLENGLHESVINLNNLPPGFYFCSLSIDEVNIDIKKLIKR